MANGLQNSMPGIMRQLAETSRDEFVNNFNTESFDNHKWKPVVRTVPPPILDVTGKLKRKTENSIKRITRNEAVLENDARDYRGKLYGEYHQTGNPPSRTQPNGMVARPFMLQTGKLTNKHLFILWKETGKIFTRV